MTRKHIYPLKTVDDGAAACMKSRVERLPVIDAKGGVIGIRAIDTAPRLASRRARRSLWDR